jgi:hypothetical protein
MSFFEERMKKIGVTPENNQITVYDSEAEFPAPSEYTMPIFVEEKSTGNIDIYYYEIDGTICRYLQMSDAKTAVTNAREKYYKTTRLKEPLGDMKYRMPPGQPTRPWFPPALVEKFNKKEPIPTLILTEGVFKAMRGSIAGLDVVGLPSITCYKGKDGKIYSDIAALIETCQVYNVIILWDGDCLNISKKDLQICEELTTRPATFFNSAKKIAELIQKIEFSKTREKCNVIFAHVKPDSHPDRPKGLDDLLHAVGQDERVVHELATQPDKSYYFFFKNITSTTASLHKYFRLDDVQKFFDFHREQIESREFKFKGSVYRWSEVNDALEMQAPEWATRVKWVGDEFFLEDQVPGAIRDQRKLISYKQGQFSKMFGDKFWNYLQHHRAFVNIPNHFNYQQVIEMPDGAKYYNRYFPYPHAPKEGSWATIKKLLLHIFGEGEVVHGQTGKAYPALEMALDYIQILLVNPTQMLPVLCLYSPENNTGKSTLGKLLMHMFGDNTVPIGNSDLQSEFNETFVDKLIAICDETLLERRRDAERIKAMSTAEQITVNPKGQKQYSIDYFCKFIFTSNNLRMIYVNKHDQRYWIMRVPVLTEDNPNMLEEMKLEIPAFTQMLMTRKLATEKESRMWFHPSLIRTRIFDDMVRVNEPTDATNLREQIREWFIADPELTEIRMTLKEIREEFFKGSANISWLQEILKDYIGVDLVRDPITKDAIFERGTYTKFETFLNSNNEEDTRQVRKAYRGRPYVFNREDFLSGKEVTYPVPEDANSTNILTHPPVIQTAMALDNPPPPEPEDLPF